jgi:hypothetical protein
MATRRRFVQRETAPSVTGSTKRGNPAGPEAARFTQYATTIFYCEETGLPKNKAGNRQGGKSRYWILIVTVLTFFVTIALEFISRRAISSIPLYGAFFVLVMFVAIGTVVDILGLAVASADLPPFLSMASKKEKGAEQSIWLIRNAERVTSILTDVMGDIANIISGATASAIVILLVTHYEKIPSAELYFGMGLTGLLAAVTVGSKAMGKSFAMRNSKDIVLFMGKVLSVLSIAARNSRRKKQNNA